MFCFHSHSLHLDFALHLDRLDFELNTRAFLLLAALWFLSKFSLFLHWQV